MSQAVAAIGQIHLSGEFQKIFDKYKVKTGQILISPDDTEQRKRALNIRRTFPDLEIEVEVLRKPRDVSDCLCMIVQSINLVSLLRAGEK